MNKNRIERKYYLMDCIARMQSMIEIDRFILSKRAKSLCDKKNIRTLKELADTDLDRIALDTELKSIAGKATIAELKQLVYEHGGGKHGG